MKKLIDTSILHAAIVAGHTEHSVCRDLLRRMMKGDFEGIVVINSFLELMASLTSSKRTVPALKPEEALEQIEKIMKLPNVEIVVPEEDDYMKALELVATLDLNRSKVFDGLILAAGVGAGARVALTLNVKDFEKFGLIPVESL